jgi:hypothetical protein
VDLQPVKTGGQHLVGAGFHGHRRVAVCEIEGGVGDLTPSAPFNWVVILSAPDGALEDGDVVAWLPPWFAHAPNGATAMANTATTKDMPFLWAVPTPICPSRNDCEPHAAPLVVSYADLHNAGPDRPEN